MKKKTMKKLVLTKETVIRLEDNLEQLAGGAVSTDPGCPTYTGLQTCATCGHTCTTNRC